MKKFLLTILASTMIVGCSDLPQSPVPQEVPPTVPDGAVVGEEGPDPCYQYDNGYKPDAGPLVGWQSKCASCYYIPWTPMFYPEYVGEYYCVSCPPDCGINTVYNIACGVVDDTHPGSNVVWCFRTPLRQE